MYLNPITSCNCFRVPPTQIDISFMALIHSPSASLILNSDFNKIELTKSIDCLWLIWVDCKIFETHCEVWGSLIGNRDKFYKSNKWKLRILIDSDLRNLNCGQSVSFSISFKIFSYWNRFFSNVTMFPRNVSTYINHNV